ncbi:tetratricopeptide repeat-containing sulfotransferase family protein [Pararobbsia silviterrae]|uniref:Sulfotransferase family protein n=1 Tax=Pararobbsia silviterrae TaxID=1792498 RepID=A0A494Y8B9_9BURK|nr:sulfotransferase [Pararobbsia silviterrae]RKP56556.1 sulfotransferase family protein [Pararobbsia silviterrae]
MASPSASSVSATATSAADALDAGDTALAARLAIALLDEDPANIDALTVLFLVREETGPTSACMALARRICALDPNKAWAQLEAAERLLLAGQAPEAEPHARNAVRLDPTDPGAHRLLALSLSAQQRWPIAEFHFRRTLELTRADDPIQLANLAACLKMQGHLDEARHLYKRSVSLAPDIAQTLHGWSQLEEAARDLPRALDLADRAIAAAPDDLDIALARAALLARTNETDQAIEIIDAVARQGRPAQAIDAALLNGRLLDKAGRFDDAFASFALAKHMIREGGRTYPKHAADVETTRLKTFFRASRLALLPRASDAPGPRPVFICGAPRSGTTLLEQMLSRHDAMAAGDELPSLGETIRAMPRLLNSASGYPEALGELWLGDEADGLDTLRDFYLRSARRAGASISGKPFFTDKMPFNETHLGLIGLMFPNAPVIRMVRHPLDVVLSMFSYDMTHGADCATSLEGIAHEYVRAHGLAEHYRAEMSLRALSVKYEALIDEPEAVLRSIFSMLDIPFEPACLRFDENPRYARTISYAQVTQRITKQARYRYRHYLRHLEPVLPILEPVIKALGYTIET